MLSPLSHQSFAFDDDNGSGNEEEADEDASDSEVKVASLRTVELQGRASTEVESKDNQKQKQVSLPENNLTPWEVWFVGKEKEEGQLQQKALDRGIKLTTREKRRNVLKKNEQKRKRTKNKEMKEKAAKELEKEHLPEKAKEKISRMDFKKNAEECEKTQTAAKSYGYANGKLTGFHNGNSYPEPAFYNPIPWKPVPMPPPKEAKDLSGKKSKRPVISQPHKSSLVIHKARSNLCLGTLCKIQR
uniref:Coiled-coil domain containing 34 n=1 Tax=Otolemur garnettii TaxID=30611 RepID=H0XMA7_OTOGA